MTPKPLVAMNPCIRLLMEFQVPKTAQLGVRAGVVVARSILLLFVLFDDVESEAMAILHAGSAEKGAHAAGGTAHLADNFADVIGSDLKADDGAVFPLRGADLHLFRLIDERLG